MIDSLIDDAKARMQRSLDHLSEELTQLRGARASAGLLDGIKVNVYDQAMPLRAIANINTPDPRTILIQPWDKTNMSAIEKAIAEDQNLGLTPNNDGNMIKLNLPALTEERRGQLTKLVAERAEACKVSMRNARHEILNRGRDQNKTKELTDDDVRLLENGLNKLIEEKNAQADRLFETKKKELAEI